MLLVDHTFFNAGRADQLKDLNMKSAVDEHHASKRPSETKGSTQKNTATRAHMMTDRRSVLKRLPFLEDGMWSRNRFGWRSSTHCRSKQTTRCCIATNAAVAQKDVAEERQ